MTLSKSLEEQAETYTEMRQQIRDQFREGWEHFDAVIFAMQQSGLVLMERDEKTEDGHSDVRHALALIHCAGTIVVYEIRTLLLEGLRSGAAARWRVLHELTVTAKLVAQNGSGIARRYIKHSSVVQN